MEQNIFKLQRVRQSDDAIKKEQKWNDTIKINQKKRSISQTQRRPVIQKNNNSNVDELVLEKYQGLSEASTSCDQKSMGIFWEISKMQRLNRVWEQCEIPQNHRDIFQYFLKIKNDKKFADYIMHFELNQIMNNQSNIQQSIKAVIARESCLAQVHGHLSMVKQNLQHFDEISQNYEFVQNELKRDQLMLNKFQISLKEAAQEKQNIMIKNFNKDQIQRITAHEHQLENDIQYREKAIDIAINSNIPQIQNQIKDNKVDLMELLEKMVQSLNHLRLLTINCLEQIVKWREWFLKIFDLLPINQNPLETEVVIPYIYQKENYILKILQDTYFLQQSELSLYLQFSDKYDPFLLKPTKPKQDSKLSLFVGPDLVNRIQNLQKIFQKEILINPIKNFIGMENLQSTGFEILKSDKILIKRPASCISQRKRPASQSEIVVLHQTKQPLIYKNGSRELKPGKFEKTPSRYLNYQSKNLQEISQKQIKIFHKEVMQQKCINLQNYFDGLTSPQIQQAVTKQYKELLSTEKKYFRANELLKQHDTQKSIQTDIVYSKYQTNKVIISNFFNIFIQNIKYFLLIQ